MIDWIKKLLQSKKEFKVIEWLTDNSIFQFLINNIDSNGTLKESVKNLATKTSHRNGVKMGIAILGLCQKKSVLNEIKVLGLHDEFTVFSTVTLSNLSDNPIQDLWELAGKVDGWGKIQIVDRIANMELTSELKDWLIMRQYHIFYRSVSKKRYLNSLLS